MTDVYNRQLGDTFYCLPLFWLVFGLKSVWSSDCTVCVCAHTCAGVVYMCVWLSPRVVGGVGLVTHYKRQKDLSPKPEHLLLGAAGALMTASTHQKTCTTFLFSLTSLQPLHVSLEADQHPLSVCSTGSSYPLSMHLRGAFTAGVLLVNWYVTQCPIRACALI